jgi:hypothetical protein
MNSATSTCDVPTWEPAIISSPLKLLCVIARSESDEAIQN